MPKHGVSTWPVRSDAVDALQIDAAPSPLDLEELAAQRRARQEKEYMDTIRQAEMLEEAKRKALADKRAEEEREALRQKRRKAIGLLAHRRAQTDRLQAHHTHNLQSPDEQRGVREIVSVVTE